MIEYTNIVSPYIHTYIHISKRTEARRKMHISYGEKVIVELDQGQIVISV